QPLEFVHIPDLFAIGLLAELLQHLMSRGRAQVSPEERGFKIVQRSPIDFLAERSYRFDTLTQIFSRAGYCFLHAIQEAGFLFFVETAKKGLNHGIRGTGCAEINYSGRGGESVTGVV